MHTLQAFTAFRPKRSNTVYDLDFSAYEDGALPAVLSGSTWAIASGVASNTPTLGSELLTDPGLEAAYTDDVCDTLTPTGTPEFVDEETSDVHGGSSAQAFEANALNESLHWSIASGSIDAYVWYQFSAWTKRVTGSTGQTMIGMWQASDNGLPETTMYAQITGADWEQLATAMLTTTSSNGIRGYAAKQTHSSLFNRVLVDDGSMKAITSSSLFALLTPTQPNIVVKIQPEETLTDNAPIGIVLRADTQTDPDSFILVLFYPNHGTSSNRNAAIMKCVSGTYSMVMATTSLGAAVEDAWFEVRASGSTIQIFYNDVQKGGDQTVSDTEILNNTHHGLFSTGSNGIKRFFAQGG